MNVTRKTKLALGLLLSIVLIPITWAEPSEVDIAFVIDDTKSMAAVLDTIIGALTKLVGELKAAGGTPPQIELITFKDEVTSQIVTNDLDLLLQHVGNLTATGGGKCPEASIEALNEAANHLKKGGRIWFATDASPHENADVAGTTALLRSKSIRMDALLSGDCASAQAYQ